MNEIKLHKTNKEAACIIKLNSLTDNQLIESIYLAAKNGMDIKLIVRGICTLLSENKKWPQNIDAISIVDQFLEHARVFYFANNGKHDMYISSADWMMRNLDYRLEVTTPILDENIKEELKMILDIQLKENEKARILYNNMSNEYVARKPNQKKVRAQVAIFNYLKTKTY